MRAAPFKDRSEAGRLLAEEVAKLGLDSPVVYALPRGGVPVAAPIAEQLAAPLDLLMVRKIGVPGHEELAAGSVVDGEQRDVILNEGIVRAVGMRQAEIDAAVQELLREIERRRALYLPGRAPVSARGRAAILVDDGIATGASMRAAIMAVRRREPASVVVAVPVAAAETVEAMRQSVDAVVCLVAPVHFGAVGYFYDDFHQISDKEVIDALSKFAVAPD